MTSLILSVETATLTGSVAVGRFPHEVHSRVGDGQQSHSNTLLKDIDRLLDQAGIVLNQIEVFATAIGPGSFTGLRIGIATIKGLSATLDRQCAGVPTLHAIAHAAGPSSATVALLPAGRGEVFAQLLSVDSSGKVIELDGPAHIPPAAMLDKYASLRPVIWCGDGAKVYAEAIREFAGKHGIEHEWSLELESRPLAKDVGIIAAKQAEAGILVQPDHLQALYVRPSDAELNPKFATKSK